MSEDRTYIEDVTFWMNKAKVAEVDRNNAWRRQVELCAERDRYRDLLDRQTERLDNTANTSMETAEDLRTRITTLEAQLAEACARTADRERCWLHDWETEHAHSKQWEARAEGDEQLIETLCARLTAVEAVVADRREWKQWNTQALADRVLTAVRGENSHV